MDGDRRGQGYESQLADPTRSASLSLRRFASLETVTTLFWFSFAGVGAANELNVSVKTIETHQMRMKEKLGVHSAAQLRQKAREWLARSAVNRIREEPEPEHVNGARFRCF